MRSGLGLGLVAALLIMAASAGRAAPAATPPAATPITVPTMFTPIPRSMAQLIGEGYQVVNIAVGLASFGYLLKQDTHYVTCAVQPDPSSPGVFVSECRAMN